MNDKKIPKIINYCWFGGKPLPLEVKKCIKSWKKYCPDYEIIEWNEKNYNVMRHPFVQSAYKAKAWAFVSDYARLQIVYENGGIYFDTDIELVKPIDDLLDCDFYIGIQQGNKFPTTGLGFGAVKGNPIVLEMMQEYEGIKYSVSNREMITCPRLNSKVIYKHGYIFNDDVWKSDEMVVYPGRFFDPLAPGKTKNLLCKDTYSIHHYAASWTSKFNVLKRKLYRIIGEDKICKIKSMLKL